MMNGTVELVVYYTTPSLNKTKRSHWAKQYREKQKAFRALWWSLKDAAYNRSTLTTSPEVLKICSTACDTLGSYLGTKHGASGSSRTKRKSTTTPMKGRS